MIIDTHCHASPVWYEPVESLLAQMEHNGVDAAVLIQMQGQFNNDYQFECVQRYPGKLASVALVDVGQADASATLEQLARQGAAGVRLGPAWRSPGADPLAIWRAAARIGLPISCGGASADFASDDFAALIAALPNLTIVLEHLGSVSKADQNEQEAAQRRTVFGLARYPNVYIKITGLGEFCRRAIPVKEPFPFEEPIPPYLDEVLASFGPRRMMWGSDFPPVSSREGYRNALRLTMERFAGCSQADRDRIFGGTASEVFKLG